MVENDLKIGTFDRIIVLATMQHQYPTFKDALVNLRSHLEDDGKLIFDICVGKYGAEPKGKQYNRMYTCDELNTIFIQSGMEVIESFPYHHEGLSDKIVFVLKKVKNDV